MPPIYGRRPRPLEPLDMDHRTVAELARVLAERLAQLDAFGGRCSSCHDAEASALLARLRRVRDAIDRWDLDGVEDGAAPGSGAAPCGRRSAYSGSRYRP